jgi:hypothetical protein
MFFRSRKHKRTYDPGRVIGPWKPMLGLLLLAMWLACFGSLGVAARDGPALYDGRWALPSDLHAALAA